MVGLRLSTVLCGWHTEPSFATALMEAFEKIKSTLVGGNAGIRTQKPKLVVVCAQRFTVKLHSQMFFTFSLLKNYTNKNCYVNSVSFKAGKELITKDFLVCTIGFKPMTTAL
jgi:hypothetical protein